MFPRVEMQTFQERAQSWLSVSVKFTRHTPSGVLGEAVLMAVLCLGALQIAVLWEAFLGEKPWPSALFCDVYPGVYAGKLFMERC